jgi:pimeloyl-ACP methyl ester carboxylesterase
MTRVVVVLAGLWLLAAGGPAAASGPEFRAEPCPDGVFPAAAHVRCGTVAVPEKRARPNGRTIRVAAAVVPAAARKPKPDPIVFLDGGPSFGAINPFALDAYFADWDLTRDRDLILVDTRGTGTSRPRLGCPELDQAELSSVYGDPFVLATFVESYSAGTAACRDRLRGQGIDLSAYNSAEGAADLDDLRRALGYRDWNLLAISADGVLGLTYMRLFPARIRSAVLDSPSSPNQLAPDLDLRRGNHELLLKVFAGCEANPACDAAYPDLRERFFELIADRQADPQFVTVPDFIPEPVTFRIDGVELWFAFATFLYPDTIHGVLADIDFATNGGIEEIYSAFKGPFEADADSFVADGKTLSYFCRDMTAFTTPRDYRQAARDVPPLAPFFRSPDRDFPFGPGACAIWGVGRAAPAQHEPVRSSIPTLVLAGEYDSTIPPLVSRQIPPTLKNSLYFEFPSSGHLQLPVYSPVSPCARAITARFMDAPARRPDASCRARLPRFDFTPPFAASASLRAGAAQSPAQRGQPRVSVTQR